MLGRRKQVRNPCQELSIFWNALENLELIFFQLIVDFQPNSMFTSKYLTFSTVNPYVIFFDTINFRMEFRKKSNARNVFAKIAPKPSEKNQNNENCIHFSSLSNACTNFYWIQRKIVKLLCKRNIPKYLFKSFSKEKNSLKTQFPNDPLT